VAQDAVETVCAGGVHRRGEWRAVGQAELAVGHGERDRQHRLDDVVRRAEGHTERGSHVPAVHHVVDEVKALRCGAGDDGIGAELRQRERRLVGAVGGEGVQHVMGCGRVGARRVGRHRVGDVLNAPHKGIGAVAAGRRGEALVLDGHVGEQVAERPPLAWGGQVKIVGRDGVDEVDGGEDGGAVQLIEHRHAHIVCERI
jgi:hypothetical protein